MSELARCLHYRRNRNSLEIAQLADKHAVRILAQRGAVTITRPLVKKQSFWASGVMPGASTVATFAGMTRKTAPTPLWSRKALARKVALRV